MILCNIETYIKSVTVQPDFIFSNINSSVLINCTISFNTAIGPDTSFIDYSWNYNNTDTDVTSNSTQLSINGISSSLKTTLTISSVTLYNVGIYECRASIDGNDTVTQNKTYLCTQG